MDRGTEAGPGEDKVLGLRRAWNMGTVIYSSGIVLSNSDSSIPSHIDLWLTLFKD